MEFVHSVQRKTSAVEAYPSFKPAVQQLCAERWIHEFILRITTTLGVEVW